MNWENSSCFMLTTTSSSSQFVLHSRKLHFTLVEWAQSKHIHEWIMQKSHKFQQTTKLWCWWWCGWGWMEIKWDTASACRSLNLKPNKHRNLSTSPCCVYVKVSHKFHVDYQQNFRTKSHSASSYENDLHRRIFVIGKLGWAFGGRESFKVKLCANFHSECLWINFITHQLASNVMKEGEGKIDFRGRNWMLLACPSYNSLSGGNNNNSNNK